mmetsp:Transcript_18345/g.55249  ORF Transcript_18345/g.55249 Transcript_18345/m.55249 type:complete len:123 (+) Transcript_18345:401-769(+)
MCPMVLLPTSPLHHTSSLLRITGKHHWPQTKRSIIRSSRLRMSGKTGAVIVPEVTGAAGALVAAGVVRAAGAEGAKAEAVALRAETPPTFNPGRPSGHCHHIDMLKSPPRRLDNSCNFLFVA